MDFWGGSLFGLKTAVFGGKMKKNGLFLTFFGPFFGVLFFAPFFGGKYFQLSYNLLVATRNHGLSKREQYFHSEFHHVETIG